MGNIIKQGIKYQFISNDDYLFAAGLLQEVRDIHKKYIIIRIPQNGLEVIPKFRTYIWILWNDRH